MVQIYFRTYSFIFFCIFIEPIIIVIIDQTGEHQFVEFSIDRMAMQKFHLTNLSLTIGLVVYFGQKEHSSVVDVTKHFAKVNLEVSPLN